MNFFPLHKLVIFEQVRLFLEGKTSEIDVTSLHQIGAIFTQFRSVVLEMERDINQQYKNKFLLLDKSDSDAMLAVQKVRFFTLKYSVYVPYTLSLCAIYNMYHLTPVLLFRRGFPWTTMATTRARVRLHLQWFL